MTKEKGTKGLAIYLFVLLALAVLLLCALWIFLGRYEINIAGPDIDEADAVSIDNPKREAFESFFLSTTPEYWADQWFRISSSGLDDYDSVVEYMDELFFSPETSCWRSIKSTAESPVYVIKNGERALAEVSLSKGRDTAWVAEEPVLLLQGEKEKSLLAPADCSVRCNGMLLSKDYIEKSGEDLFFIDEYKEIRENPVYWNAWKVSGLLLDPVMTVAASDETAIKETDSDVYSRLCASDITEKYTPKVNDFAEKLIYFFMNGSNLTAYNAKKVLNCIREGSQAEDAIRSIVRGVYLNTYYEEYTLDYTCGPFIQWADNCISATVSYSIPDVEEGLFGEIRVLLVDYGRGFEICGFNID
jgi:hypothetical protein